MSTQFSLENHTSTNLNDRSFIVWPARPNSGCTLERVNVNSEVRDGTIRAILTSATTTILRCHLDVIFANIILKNQPKQIISISFEGDKNTKTLKPYINLLLREIGDILQKLNAPGDLAQGIVRRLSSIDLEIKELKLSVRAYNEANSISGKKEFFDIFVASHTKKQESQMHLFAKYRLQIDISEEEVTAILSGERIVKNGSFGDTMYAEVVKSLIANVALGLFWEGYIEERDLEGITSFLLDRNGIPVIKVVFKRD